MSIFRLSENIATVINDAGTRSVYDASGGDTFTSTVVRTEVHFQPHHCITYEKLLPVSHVHFQGTKLPVSHTVTVGAHVAGETFAAVVVDVIDATGAIGARCRHAVVRVHCNVMISIIMGSSTAAATGSLFQCRTNRFRCSPSQRSPS